MNEQPDLSKTELNRRLCTLQQALDELRAERERERLSSSAEIETLRSLALKDKLTGLGNRNLLEQRTHARGGFFVLCDLDGFKRAQDAHPEGHIYGDRILREFADFLVAIIRTNRARSEDRVAIRLGGDEFCVWCPTRAAARRIKKLVRMWRSHDGAVGASAGMGLDMAHADATLFANKRARKEGRTWSAHVQ